MTSEINLLYDAVFVIHVHTIARRNQINSWIVIYI